jgi:hypothetical protein
LEEKRSHELCLSEITGYENFDIIRFVKKQHRVVIAGSQKHGFSVIRIPKTPQKTAQKTSQKIREGIRVDDKVKDSNFRVIYSSSDPCIFAEANLDGTLVACNKY